MIEKIEVKSSFLEEYLSDFPQIHFLGNDEDASLYIRVGDLESFKDVKASFWIELLQTNFAPIIVLYLELNKDNKKFVFDFIYDVKDESDLLELNDIIKHLELNINVIEIQKEKLFFAYTYVLSLNNYFIEELKRIILQAKEYSRKIAQNYDIDSAIDDFLDGNSIFKLKTNVVEELEVLFSQKSSTEILEEEAEDGFFTYKSNTSGDFHDNGANLQVKVYKRDEYENLKNNKTTSSNKRGDTEGELAFLKNKLKQLEVVLKSKNIEIERLKTENIHLKEELEYQKLDTPKKGWKIFK